MVRIFIFLFLALFIDQLFAQENADTIEVKKYITMKYFSYHGKPLNISGLYKLTLNHPAAHAEMVKAKTENIIQGCLLGVTIGTIVWALGKNTQQETKEILLFSTLGLSITGIIIGHSVNKHGRRAVHLYNQDILSGYR